MDKLQVQMNREKTKVVNLKEGGSFSFLGFDIRLGRKSLFGLPAILAESGRKRADFAPINRGSGATVKPGANSWFSGPLSSPNHGFIAFSSEVDTGSREENASKQESRAPVLIQSEPIML